MRNSSFIIEIIYQIITVIQPARNAIFTQQKRFRGKINIQKPRAPHHERGKVEKFVTPFISNPLTPLPWKERCDVSKRLKVEKIPNPYNQIIAREIFNWFKSSRMIAIFHVNSILAEDRFDFAVKLKKANMYLKAYSPPLMNLALKETIYEPVLHLTQTLQGGTTIAFSPDTKNVEKLFKITKKTPQIFILAGILDGKLLNQKEFLEYGKLDIKTAQAGLVQVLRTAAGGNLNRQLTHHQSTLVTRLKQIGTNEEKPCDVKE